MNAVEIEEAISALAEQSFDSTEFPFAFLEAFGNKPTTIKRLRTGSSNKSDLGGVLQTNNIHIAVCPKGEVTKTLAALKASPATANAKVKFVLATDGVDLEAEDLASDLPPVICAFADFPNHFGFFLPLAGITTVKQIRESSFDIRATSRLNKLYVELLKDNPEWGTTERSHDMNHFMARLIFCFFAEDTNIFKGDDAFTATIERMSARDSSNTHEIISALFLAMNTESDDHDAANVPRWANDFPYVNGGLFSGSTDVPVFSRIARSYLLHIGGLDWQQINPDIFGSMIQAVTDDEERGELGMHYTSVPNILKVLNPLFLDDLRSQLDEAGDNARKLLNLRKRMSNIRVFDPACGSGNFLVIAYKEMRLIESEINKRRNEGGEKTAIPLTNFRGIELRDFPAEVARLALIIAEYQCDVLYRGQRDALADFLPLDAKNWITCGNALRLDWLSICQPTGTEVKFRADDLFHSPLDQAQIDFENKGGETYICGNPPYIGYNKQSKLQKDDLQFVFSSVLKKWGNLDYVTAWFLKASQFLSGVEGASALVSTNSICQGGQVAVLWPLIKKLGMRIHFAHTSFKWSNLAAKNAGITVIVVGLVANSKSNAKLYDANEDGTSSLRVVPNINGYLAAADDIYVKKSTDAISAIPKMSFGNHPYYGAELILNSGEVKQLEIEAPEARKYIRPIYGSAEVIKGLPRACLWIEDEEADEAYKIPAIKRRLDAVQKVRSAKTSDNTAQSLATAPHRFRDRFSAKNSFIAVPQTTSENREYLPCDLFDERPLVTFKCFAIYDAPLWSMALVASRLQITWIAAICGRLELRYSYSNTLGWNTFPVPTLTEKNKTDLTACAQNILLAREAHFPKTIADLYEIKKGERKMPEDLRRAHERNDEVLERIYIGRRFKNDTERLEKLFELYTKMTTKPDLSKANSKMKAVR